MARQDQDSQRGRVTLDNWLSIRPGRHQNGQSSQANSRPSKSMNELIHRGRVMGPQKKRLMDVAVETRKALPDILQHLPHLAPTKSEAYYYDRLPPLRAADCPKRTPSGKTTIRIVNEDTFNAAIELESTKGPGSGRVAVLNMASDIVAGGGWLKGAMAQEEALCYRSSLYLSLHRRYYPFRRSQAVYSPEVVIIRSDMSSGHDLLVPDVKPEDLPVVGVLSVAALRTPATRTITTNTPDGEVVKQEVFADPEARELTKGKMRLCLRMAAHNDHGLLVLGALGCGAFRNPKEDVAACWLEVLREAEFQGGWWEEVWFAVYDRQNEGNFELFDEVLGGVEI
ncbi:hypothetical protein PT974_01984 [Cladobotryum mycophilum]|uniref:Microbial-type PARG catalytic domain-containing protein n=1 Tax=Cladobotryum mycophilum TaxID=491253 RepID=A0ABR0SY09_9HYPO